MFQFSHTRHHTGPSCEQNTKRRLTAMIVQCAESERDARASSRKGPSCDARSLSFSAHASHVDHKAKQNMRGKASNRPRSNGGAACCMELLRLDSSSNMRRPPQWRRPIVWSHPLGAVRGGATALQLANHHPHKQTARLTPYR